MEALPMGLEEILAQLQGVQTGQQDALTELISAQTQPVNRGLLAEGQTFGGMFKDPTDAQREGFLQAGLALLGSSDNDNLSQRIGQAIGQGVGAIREAREVDSERDMAAAKGKLAQLQLQGKGLETQFGLGLQAANYQLSSLRERNTERRHRETEYNKALRAQQKYLADQSAVRGVGNFQYTDNGQTRTVPVMRTNQGMFLTDENRTPLERVLTPEQAANGVFNPPKETNRELLDLQDARDKTTDPQRLSEINARIKYLTERSGGIQVTTDKDGVTTTTIGGRQGKPSQIVNDAMVEADIAAGGIFRFMDVMFDPAFDKSSGRLAGRLSRMTSFFQPEEVRAVIDRVKKSGNMSGLANSHLVKPLTENEFTKLVETFGFNPFLTAESNVKEKMTLAIPEGLSTIETAHNSIQNSGSYFRSRMAEEFFVESFEAAMQNGSAGNLLAQGYGNVFMEQWAPRVSPQFAGRGYYDVKGKAVSEEMMIWLSRQYGRTLDQFLELTGAEIIE